MFAYVRGIGPFANLKSGGSTATMTSPSPVSISSPSPTPESTSSADDLDKSEPKIHILNGSGVSGVASVVKNLLEDAGWTVSMTTNKQF